MEPIMQRRHLAQSAALAAAAAIIPAAAKAEMDANKNVIFTADDPGHWAAVEKLHVPIVTASAGVLTVKTPHPMSEPHFIVSHTVVLADGKFLDRKTFTYKDEPVSTHMLPPGYTGPVTVTSSCNLHDFWVKTVSV
jgi:superoxide reductase